MVLLQKEIQVSGENPSVRSRAHTLSHVLTSGIEPGFALMRDQDVNHWTSGRVIIIIIWSTLDEYHDLSGNCHDNFYRNFEDNKKLNKTRFTLVKDLKGSHC